MNMSFVLITINQYTLLVLNKHLYSNYMALAIVPSWGEHVVLYVFVEATVLSLAKVASKAAAIKSAEHSSPIFLRVNNHRIYTLECTTNLPTFYKKSNTKCNNLVTMCSIIQQMCIYIYIYICVYIYIFTHDTQKYKTSIQIYNNIIYLLNIYIYVYMYRCGEYILPNCFVVHVKAVKVLCPWFLPEAIVLWIVL